MTKKRWMVLAGMLVACVCLTLAVLALLPPRPAVTPENIERIEHGMTLEEVEKALGGRGEDLLPRMTTVLHVRVVAWSHAHDKTWVHVSLDPDDRVEAIYWGPPQTFMQKFRRLLHL